MKILIATGIYPPSIGGPATYSQLLCTELPTRDVDVEVLSFDSVRHLPKGISHLAFWLKVTKAARKADLIYAQDPVSVGLPSQLAAQLFFKPFFLRLGGDYAWEQGVQRYGITDDLDTFAARRAGYPLLVMILKRIQVHVAFWARRVIVPSEYLKKVVTSWGINPDKISVIKNVIEPLPQLADKAAERARWKITAPTLVTVGRLVPWKGFLQLIEMMPDLLLLKPDLRLVIIGDGPQLSELENRVNQLNLQKSVEFKGRMKRNELLSYVKAADLFVLNTFYEGFSHQVIESQSVGTPVVTTTAGGNGEAIRHEVDGILVSPHDQEAMKRAIIDHINNEAKRKMLSENGLKTVTQWSVTQMLDTLMNELHR